MTINILFSASTGAWEKYEEHLRVQLNQLSIEYQLHSDFPPEIVDYIIYTPKSGLIEFSPYIRCKAVLNLWAGVESIAGNETLKMPLARMVDHGLTQGMVEWVVGHVMRHHLGIDLQINGQDGVWRAHTPPLAEERTVTFLGLGILGASSGQALRQLGFNVRGWSRHAKTVDGIKCYHGADGLKTALSGADFVILLLPETLKTKNTLNIESLSLLKKGAFVINPGRGPLIDDEALIKMLDMLLHYHVFLYVRVSHLHLIVHFLVSNDVAFLLLMHHLRLFAFVSCDFAFYDFLQLRHAFLAAS